MNAPLDLCSSFKHPWPGARRSLHPPALTSRAVDIMIAKPVVRFLFTLAISGWSVRKAVRWFYLKNTRRLSTIISIAIAASIIPISLWVMAMVF